MKIWIVTLGGKHLDEGSAFAQSYMTEEQAFQGIITDVVESWDSVFKKEDGTMTETFDEAYPEASVELYCEREECWYQTEEINLPDEISTTIFGLVEGISVLQGLIPLSAIAKAEGEMKISAVRKIAQQARNLLNKVEAS